MCGALVALVADSGGPRPGHLCAVAPDQLRIRADRRSQLPPLRPDRLRLGSGSRPSKPRSGIGRSRSEVLRGLDQPRPHRSIGGQPFGPVVGEPCLGSVGHGYGEKTAWLACVGYV